MEPSYLIRYGTSSQVGRFGADVGTTLDRGDSVVVRTHRGIELGEVLVETSHRAAEAFDSSSEARVLRPANAEDLVQARRVESDRARRFAACARVIAERDWPIDVIDAEPLLDDGRTVIHYLGSHHLDVTELLADFRARCGLDVMFQAVGLDEPEDEPAPELDDHGCGSCSASGGGGCGSESASGCGSSGGCGDCGVKKLLSARR